MPNNNILAIDTSNSGFSILAEIDGQSILYQSDDDLKTEYFYNSLDRLAEQFPDFINRIDTLAACIGPGRFNGLRVGLMFVSTMMVLTRKPCFIVNSFDLLWAQSNKNPDTEWIAIYAKNNFAYAENRRLAHRDFVLKPYHSLPDCSLTLGLGSVSGAFENYDSLNISFIKNLIYEGIAQQVTHPSQLIPLYISHQVQIN